MHGCVMMCDKKAEKPGYRDSHSKCTQTEAVGDTKAVTQTASVLHKQQNTASQYFACILTQR